MIRTEYEEYRMKLSPSSVFDQLLPSADRLWERGGAELDTREVDGRLIEVPVFPLEVEIGQNPLASEVFRSKRKGRLLGATALYEARVNDGQLRHVRVNRIDDTVRNEALDFFVTRGTAWFTGLEGYGKDRIDATSAQLGVDTIHIGPAASGAASLGDVSDVLRAGTTHSLAKSSQTKQLIIAQLQERFGLTSKQITTGCSMDDMETFGEITYANTIIEGGVPIIWHDGVAPCGLEDLALKDMPKIAKWFASELATIPSLISDAARHGHLDDLAKTIAIDPYSLLYSIIGNMPAVASDEAKRMLSWLPSGTRGHQTIYLNDGMSGEAWTHNLNRALPYIYTKEVNRKHFDLVRERARRCQLGRLACYGDEYETHSGRVENMNYTAIAIGKPQRTPLPVNPESVVA